MGSGSDKVPETLVNTVQAVHSWLHAAFVDQELNPALGGVWPLEPFAFRLGEHVS